MQPMNIGERENEDFKKTSCPIKSTSGAEYCSKNCEWFDRKNNCCNTWATPKILDMILKMMSKDGYGEL